ncbi:MAG: hypothetical protein Q9207_002663 [Kuettlingeria erythrocarpa]
MYQVRFAKWGLGKNLKREEREEYFKEKEAGKLPSGTDIDRKLQRYDRKRFEKIENSRRAMGGKDVQPGGSLQASVPANRAESDRPRDCSDTGHSHNSTVPEHDGTRDLTQQTFPGYTFGNEMMELFPDLTFPAEESEVSCLSLSGMAGPTARRQEALAMASSPSRPLSIGAEDLNIELVLHCVQDSTNGILSAAQFSGSEYLAGPPSTSNLWSHASQCVYLFKVGHLQRAQLLVDWLCSNVMQAALYPSMTSLLKLITTFSPINFRRYPHSLLVRRRLLHHLVDSASKTRPQTDPLLVISKQLLRDRDTLATTEVALSCLIDTMQDRSPAFVHRANRARIALLRRDGQLDHALDRATELVAATSRSTTPKSVERRGALAEKAHILMDRRKEGDLYEALDLCKVRVGICVTGGRITTYRDESAMYTMEDMAKIHDELNELEKSVVWLEQAADIGRDLRVDRMAMTHVVDKLMDAQTRRQRNSELELYKKMYEPFMWVPQ